MEEEKKNEEATLNVPVLPISKEELEENQKLMSTAQSVLTPPEGQVLVGLRSFCPVHGDITRASRIIKYTTYRKSEVDDKVHPISASDCICLACVSDFWRNEIVAKYPKGEDGEPGKIQIAPVFVSEEKYNEFVEAQKKKEAEAKSKANEDTSGTEESTESTEAVE